MTNIISLNVEFSLNISITIYNISIIFELIIIKYYNYFNVVKQIIKITNTCMLLITYPINIIDWDLCFYTV